MLHDYSPDQFTTGFFKVYVGPYRRRRQQKQAQQPSADITNDNGREPNRANNGIAEAAAFDDDDDDDDDDSLEPVDLDKLLVGLYVAVDKAEWSNRPLIGKVQSIGADTVQIHWLDGSYDGTFRDSFVGSGANRHSWTEDITKNQIVMIGVQFTNSRRLRKEDIEELRARYQMIDEQNDKNSDDA